MSVERECPHSEQAVALALHALEPADEGLMASHVPHCTVCQEVVRQTQDVVWGLAASAEPLDPPARLRTDLLAAVAATEQLPAERREQPWQPDQPAHQPVRPDPAEHGTSRLAEGAPAAGAAAGAAADRQARWRLIALVATFAVAVAGVGGVTYQLLERAQQEQAAIAVPSPTVARLLAEADRAGARHAVLHAPDGTVMAAVAQFPDSKQVMPIQLPANRPDHTYVLWGLGNGAPEAIGTFDVAAPSETMLPVQQPARTGAFARYAISIENGRAMPASPGLVLASGRVAS